MFSTTWVVTVEFHSFSQGDHDKLNDRDGKSRAGGKKAKSSENQKKKDRERKGNGKNLGKGDGRRNVFLHNKIQATNPKKDPKAWH